VTFNVAQYVTEAAELRRKGKVIAVFALDNEENMANDKLEQSTTAVSKAWYWATRPVIERTGEHLAGMTSSGSWVAKLMMMVLPDAHGNGLVCLIVAKVQLLAWTRGGIGTLKVAIIGVPQPHIPPLTIRGKLSPTIHPTPLDALEPPRAIENPPAPDGIVNLADAGFPVVDPDIFRSISLPAVHPLPFEALSPDTLIEIDPASAGTV